jgi:hypothetical protein
MHRLTRFWPEGTYLLFRRSAASAAPFTQELSPGRGITRRRLLASGGAAAGAAAVGFQPWDPAKANAADWDTPKHLVRGSYLKLSTPDFSSSRLGSGAGLKLVSVADLGAAATVKSLVNSEDAFALTFISDTEFESGTRTLAHPDLGLFELFLTPVEGKGSYEAIVNRSVGVPKRPPRALHTPDKNPPPPRKPANPPHVRSAGVRRVGKDLVVQVALEPDEHVRSVSVWLTHAGLVVGAQHIGSLKGRDRVAVRLATRRRPRGGHYLLWVGTKDRRGHTEYKRVKIALQ